MAKHGENIYKRKDGRWEARVIKGYSESGKALYAYFYGRTYREAKEKILASIPLMYNSHSEQTNIATPRFGAVLDSWLEHKKADVKQSTFAKYFNTVNNHIKPQLGEYHFPEINSALINNFVGEKQKSGKYNASGGLSEKTARGIISVIKAALKYAKQELMLPEISLSLSVLRDKPKDMRVLTKEEQTALEKYLCADIDESKLGILLCLYTGLRVGEICALKWCDISLDVNMLTVRRTMQRVQTLDGGGSRKTKVIETDPKSDNSARTIPLPECVLDKLKCFRPDAANAYLITGEADRYIEPRTYQNRFKTYIIGSGIKDANFHSTRHTFATRCVELGFEIKSLSKILGHANVNITLDRYVHPSFDMKRDNMNKLSLLGADTPS